MMASDRALKVLVVEDNPDDFASLKRTYSKSHLPFELVRCARAEDALALVIADPSAFQAVVTDYNLPGMTGLDLAQKLIDLNVPFPLLMLTGHGSEAAAVQALKIGIFDYIVKDVSSQEFKSLPETTLNAVKRYENNLHEIRLDNQLRKLSAAVEQSSSIILITNKDGEIEYVNAAFTKITGYTLAEVAGKRPSVMAAGHMSPEIYKKLWADVLSGKEWRGEFQNRKKNGELYWSRAAISPVRNHAGEIINFVEIQDDITEAKKLSDLLYYQAAHDPLTGLINRREFERRLQNVLEKARSDNSEHALCYLDLDQFKIINDTCGHIAGDELLRQLGAILLKTIRKCDTLARLGGDEFGILMEYCPSDKAAKVADEQREAIENFSFVWENKSFRIGVSIGLVPITLESGHLSDILKEADAACYAAKDQGRNRVCIYRPDDERVVSVRDHMQWVGRINRALQENRFLLYRQDIMSIEQAHDEGMHYELLLRLEEDGNIYPPGAFLPAAERYNVSSKIDKWVVAKTLQYLSEDNARIAGLHHCAINLSGQTLNDNDFLDFVINKFKETNIPPEKICFEITETSAIVNLTKASYIIKNLKNIGCLFSLDDFGSGLSSFAYLKNLPVDFLKIDGMFVKDIVSDPIDFAMVRSINDIGHVMGKKTIAEFVENAEILEKLRSIGVDYAQGYGIAKPVPML